MMATTFDVIENTVLLRLNPQRGRLFETFCYCPREKNIYTLFELLDEDIVSKLPSFNLIDEENDDEELEILLTF